MNAGTASFGIKKITVWGGTRSAVQWTGRACLSVNAREAPASGKLATREGQEKKTVSS